MRTNDALRTVKSCGSGAAVLALTCDDAFASRRDGGKNAVPHGEHEAAVKTIAQGRPGVLG